MWEQSWTLASCVCLPTGCCTAPPITSYAATTAIKCLLNQHQQQPAELQIKHNQSVFYSQLKIKWGLHGSSQSLCNLLFSTNQMDCHTVLCSTLLLFGTWILRSCNLQIPTPQKHVIYCTRQSSISDQRAIHFHPEERWELPCFAIHFRWNNLHKITHCPLTVLRENTFVNTAYSEPHLWTGCSGSRKKLVWEEQHRRKSLSVGWSLGHPGS